ncbi:MAG: hypothetical protein IJ565_04555 [Bacilli bacterium]|nr:hypothetical protein [Bacilli bacterium]
MNIADLVTRHIDSHNYDDLTKVRWIYLFLCSLFSYDIRFVLQKNDSNDLGYNINWESLRNEIYNKELDITNVNDFEIICLTMAKVLVDTLKLYGFEGEIRKDPSKYLHVHVVVKVGDYTLKLDPMLTHDNTRVKLHCTTKDFVDLNNSPLFNDILKGIDIELGYYNKTFLNRDGIDYLYRLSKYDKNYKEDYTDVAIKNVANIFEQNADIFKLTQKEKLIKKLDLISYLINDKKDFTRYDDIDFYMNYLLNNLLTQEDKSLIRPSSFWHINPNGEWDITTLIMVLMPNNLTVYRISKENENFYMRQINPYDLNDLFENNEGINKRYFKMKLNENGIRLK